MTVDATDPLVDALAPLLARRWLLVGVGNDMRGDDGFGSRLARRVAAGGGPALDAGIAPENMTGPIRRAEPEVLLIADAAELGGPPGTIRVLDTDDLAAGGTCTHDPSLSILIQFLRSEREYVVRILAAQPSSRVFGDDPSPAVLAAEDRLTSVLLAR